MARRPVDTGWRHAPGRGDLTNSSDPQNETSGGCEECDGPHTTNRCPHLTGATTKETHR